jgi:antirestriction protein
MVPGDRHKGEDMTLTITECPEHGGAFDCTPFCRTCEGEQETPHPRIVVLAGFLGTDDIDALTDHDDEAYCGQWDTFREYVEQYAEDCDLLAGMPEDLRRYFDYDALARDLRFDHFYDDETGYTWRQA